MPLEDIHMGTLAPYLHSRKGRVKAATINRTLAVTRRILNLSARLWRDESGKTWLAESPLLQLLPKTDARKPRSAFQTARVMLPLRAAHLISLFIPISRRPHAALDGLYYIYRIRYTRES